MSYEQLYIAAKGEARRIVALKKRRELGGTNTQEAPPSFRPRSIMTHHQVKISIQEMLEILEIVLVREYAMYARSLDTLATSVDRENQRATVPTSKGVATDDPRTGPMVQPQNK